jgi:osmotically-inducible protein OsmY
MMDKRKPGADYWKIDVESTNGNVVLMGYVDGKQSEERVVEKIRRLRGVKSVKSLLTVEARRSSE